MKTPALFSLGLGKTSLFPTTAALATSAVKRSSPDVCWAVFSSALRTVSVAYDTMRDNPQIVPASYFSLNSGYIGAQENQSGQ